MGRTNTSIMRRYENNRIGTERIRRFMRVNPQILWRVSNKGWHIQLRILYRDTPVVVNYWPASEKWFCKEAHVSREPCLRSLVSRLMQAVNDCTVFEVYAT